MVLAGARICNEGVGIDGHAEEKIQQMINTIKAILPSSGVSMRLLKTVGRVENKLSSIKFSGVVVPWATVLDDGTESNFKLVCPSGVEYFFAEDDEWASILNWYSWEEVVVVGLLNRSNLTIIPQKVFPKGSAGEREKVIDLVSWKSQTHIGQIAKNLKDLMVVPAAIGVAMAL